MSLFHFDSAASAREAERVLRDAGLRQDVERPVLGARLRDESVKVLFANRSMLALFDVQDLAGLTRRLFAAGDPGSKRLKTLAAPATGPRLERLRFYAHGHIVSYTFQCLWPKGDGDSPLLLVSILDAPSFAALPQSEAEPIESMAQDEAPVASPVETPAPEDEAPAASAATASNAAPLVVHLPARPVRFLWRTDAQDRFVEITPPLAEVVGAGPASLIGKSLAEVREGLRLDPEGRLVEAFAKRDTWSGIEVLWPVAGAQRLVPVVLGGLPGFDADRAFEGFHGFGVIYGHRAIETTAPAWQVWPSHAGDDRPVAQDTPETASHEPVSHEPVSHAPANPDPQEVTQRSDALPVAGNVIMLAPIVERLRQAADKEAADKEAADKEAAEKEAAEREKVGLLRAPSASDLSSEEQNAFQEIARALSDDTHETSSYDKASSDEASLFDPPETSEAAPDAEAATATLKEEDHSEAPQAPDEAAKEPEAASEPASPVFVATRETLAPDPLIRNAEALFGVMQAGLAVFRNEEPVFANAELLKLLGQADLDMAWRSGLLSSLLHQASAERPKLVSFAGADGAVKQLVAREQCLDWDGFPATLLVVQDDAERDDTKTGDYERESLELNAILDTATDGVAVIDTKGRIVTLNRSGEALFGYDQNDVAGQPFSVLFHGESKTIAEDYLDGLKSQGVKSLLNDGREVVGRARQGGLIPIFMTLGRVSGSDVEEKDLKFCALLRDMTHWKKVEQELDQARKEAEHASAMKSDFLAKVSHEIRTPLNAILGFAEVIMDERFGPIGNERYKDYLKDIHMSGAHVMSLVNDLLDLSKIEAGKLELNFQEIDANKVISECVALMQPQANRERVIMRMSLAPQLPRISADERSLRQIILNLLSNAVKFNEPGGQVIIATVALGSGHAIVRIKDTGIGMSEDDIGLALEPFHQLATTRQTIGTGLGLPLTKALVEANHAFFSIKSKKQEGTLVEVTFPVVEVSA